MGKEARLNTGVFVCWTSPASAKEHYFRVDYRICGFFLGCFGLGGDAREIARLEVAPSESLERWKNHRDETDVAELHRIGKVALQKFGYWMPE